MKAANEISIQMKTLKGFTSFKSVAIGVKTDRLKIDKISKELIAGNDTLGIGSF